MMARWWSGAAGLSSLAIARLDNPAAPDHHLAIIEDGRLAGRYGALRLVEADENLVSPGPLDCGGSGLVTMANFDRHARRLIELVDRNQIRAFRSQDL